MSTLKKLILLLVLVFATANLVYAAVNPIANTPFSSRGRSGDSGSSGDGGGKTTTFTETACVEPTAATSVGCAAVLGTDSYNSEQCVSGRYNCSCSSAIFTEVCDPDTEYGIDGCGVGADRKYRSCVAKASSCLDVSAAYGNHGEYVASIDACKTKLGLAYSDSYSAKICTDAGVQKFFCPFPPCSILSTTSFTLQGVDSQPLKDAGGAMSGVCYQGADNMSPWYCNRSIFIYTAKEQASCAPFTEPRECSLETTPLYGVPCTTPTCGATDRTVMNISSASTPVTACPVGSVKSKLCLINRSGTETIYNVCSCNKSTAEYYYTQASCQAAVDPSDTRVFHAATPSTNNTDYCLWDAQTALDIYTGKSSGAYDPTKIRYKNCSAECPAGITTSVSSCDRGAELTECSIANTAADKVNNPYLTIEYCACPKDDLGNDLYHLSCPEGTYLGGRTCTYENNQVKYEFCLPKCTTSNDRKFVSNPTNTACDNVPQSDASANYGKFVCSNNGTTAATCSSITTKCCLQNGATLSSCSENFVVFEDNIHCMSYSSKLPTQLCLKANKSAGVSWQCGCYDYKSLEECTADENKSGTGKTCKFDGTDEAKVVKYESCVKFCDKNADAIKADAAQCKLGTYDPFSVPCVEEGGDGTTKYNCSCPSTFKTLDQYCIEQGSANIEECKKAKLGYETVCKFDLSKAAEGVTPTPVVKYGVFDNKCPTNTKAVIGTTISACTFGGAVNTDSCHTETDLTTQRYVCKCPATHKTVEEYCKNRYPGEDEAGLAAYANCVNTTTGVGTVCEFDVADRYDNSTPKLKKYATFAQICPKQEDRPSYESTDSCKLKDETPKPAVPCYIAGVSTAKYLCSCPDSFVIECTGDNEGKVPAGKACPFDSTVDVKYEGCFPQCSNTAKTPVVPKPSNCAMVNGVAADTEECYLKAGDPEKSYACRCPKTQNYQTLAQYCALATPKEGEDQAAATARCMNESVGVGSPCTFDVDDNGLQVDKYKSFDKICPTDRPLFFSTEECTSGLLNGVVEGTCHVKAGDTQERILCKCSSSFVTSCSKNNSSTDADGNPVTTPVPDPDKDTAGKTCNYEGDTKIKYEGCFTRCDKIQAQGIEYLGEDEASDFDCKNKLGDGAFFGVNGAGAQCSKNHVLMSPCYCSSTYQECPFSENLRPADDSVACTINGTTYYDQCVDSDCAQESGTVALIDRPAADDTRTPEQICKGSFGSGASGKLCGADKVQCSCNSREYIETCEYPLEPPLGSDGAVSTNFCRWSSSGNMSTSSPKHYPAGSCRIKPTLAVCGKNVLNPDGSNISGVTINVAATEGECKSRFGTGAKTQLCEYEDNNNRRAYNCYYNASKFPAVESTCPVRHVLSGDYIIVGGVKHYESCICHPAYKSHKYNCAGMLSGGACNQTLTADQINADSTLKSAGITAGSSLSYYPYCQCTADYNQECDGDRNVGVGQPCNGKYTACECKPDPLPENWADNYYGCAGGKQPTGVVKANGCGGKYYQCSVTQCTWQHSEKCEAPLVGVDPCQDNLGNIGGYKSCKCPNDYTKLCSEDGKSGKGEPCILKGKYYYTQCEDIGQCTHGENKLCQGEFLVGVNPCTKNGITYFQYCTCGSSYNKLCENGEVGEGSSCKLDGKEYFSKCVKPSTACTPAHKEACDYNQEKYDPCVNSSNKLMYKCKCPANYKSCADGGAADAQTCVDSEKGILYSDCAVSDECTFEQNKNYKVCTSSQKGVGGSCVQTTISSGGAETKIIKYAQCEDTDSCRSNGYQYTCMGYNVSGQTDFCDDKNGNRLYKECKCPTNYVPCGGKNNTKGQSCVPLLSDGSTGTTLYASCSCAPERYLYTCKPSETNKGLIPAKAKSCKPCTYKEGSSNECVEGDEFYEACDCNELYSSTCKANGQVGDDSDFCERSGAQRLYKQCTCKSEFSLDCTPQEGNPGLMAPSDLTKACVAVAQGGNEQAPKYSVCECGKYYDLKCSDYANTVGPENDFCKVSEGAVTNTYYRVCGCDRGKYPETCKETGLNTGVTQASSASELTCNEATSKGTGKGDATTTPYYSSCKCKDNYKFSCDPAINDNQVLSSGDTKLTYTSYTKDKYNFSGQTYCALNSDEAVKKYTECKCGSDYKYEDCENVTTGVEYTPIAGASYCLAVGTNGVYKKMYKIDQCGCVPKAISADFNFTANITQASDKNLASFKEDVAKNCIDPGNYKLADDTCGTIKYKCVVSPTTYKYNAKNCKKTNSGSVDWALEGDSSTLESSFELGVEVKLYSSCGCPTLYNNPNDCQEIAKRSVSEGDINSGISKPYCYEVGHGRGSGTGTYYGKSCYNDFGTATIVMIDSTYCVNSSGAKYYKSDNCRCNSSYFKDPNCYGDWDRDAQWCQRCTDQYGLHGHVTNW